MSKIKQCYYRCFGKKDDYAIFEVHYGEFGVVTAHVNKIQYSLPTKTEPNQKMHFSYNYNIVKWEKRIPEEEKKHFEHALGEAIKNEITKLDE